jgi:hypothetical protein
MASYFVHEPTDSYTVADQHLIYELETDSTIDDAFRYVITVYQGTITGTLLGKFYLTPNPSEIGMFNLAEAVRGLCQVDDRTYGGTTVVHSLLSNYFTRSNGNIKHFTVGVGEWDGSTEAVNQDTSALFLVDGHFQISDGFNASFTDYYGTASTKKYWLTDRTPASNIITINAAEDDEGVVAFLNRDTMSDVEQLTITLYNESGSFLANQSVVINATNGAQSPGATSQYYYGYLCYFGVYPANIDAMTSLLTNNPTWSYYTITPQITAFAIQRGNRLRINKNCRPLKHQAVQLAWANSVGSWDYLRFDGRKLKTVTREEKTYRKQIGDYNAASFSFTPFDREITPYQVEAKETYQLNGILTSEEYGLFQYCFRSKNIMARIDGTWIPVTLKESSLQVESDTTSKVYIATINVELAQLIRC